MNNNGGHKFTRPFVDAWDEDVHKMLTKEACFSMGEAVADSEDSLAYKQYLSEKHQAICSYYSVKKNDIAGNGTDAEPKTEPECTMKAENPTGSNNSETPSETKPEQKPKRIMHSEENMFGIIANSEKYLSDNQCEESLGEVIYKRLKRMHNNRTPFRLVDLHEICLCYKISPNELFEYKSPASDIEFFDVNDLIMLQRKIASEQMHNKLDIIVCTSPLTGMSLIAHITDYDIEFSIKDALGIFRRAVNYDKNTDTIKYHNSGSASLPFFEDREDRNEKWKHRFNDAKGQYDKCVKGAKGLADDVSEQSYKALRIIESELPINNLQRLYESKSTQQRPGKERIIDLTLAALRRDQKALENGKIKAKENSYYKKDNLDTLVARSGVNVKCSPQIKR